MNLKRRDMLRLTGLIGLMAATGLISQVEAAEWNKAAFDGKSLDEVLKSLGGSSVDKSSAVVLTVPDIAENGAVVPVAVSTSLPKIQQIAILVDKNPSALAAQFFMTLDTEPFVAARVKMAQTSNIHALVKSDGKWYVATKEVKVTLGGCGG